MDNRKQTKASNASASVHPSEPATSQSPAARFKAIYSTPANRIVRYISTTESSNSSLYLQMKKSDKRNT
jgi:hypothetical protein